MKILAIDPGNIESGYVIWDGEKILKMGKENNELIINDVYNTEADYMAIEMVASYGMPVGKSVFDTCVWIGRFIEAWKSKLNIFWELIYRKDVKMHLCHTMRAKDSNIRQALIDRFEPGLQARKRPADVLKGLSKDMWSAMAIAVYSYDKIMQANGIKI